MDTAPMHLTQRLQKLNDYLFFSAAAAALGLAALSGYTLIYRAALKLWLAWTAPLAFLITAGVLLGLFWQRQNVKRALEAAAPAEAYPPDAPAPTGLKLLAAAAALGYLVLFLLVGGVSLRAVYNNNHFAGLVFALIYAALTGLEILAGWSVRNPGSVLDLRATLIPGKLSLVRLGAFGLGFALPMASMGLQASQLPVINALFQREKPWAAVKDVPDAAVIGLGLLGFAVLEGLIGQAGSAWQRLNRGETLPAGRWAVIARWALGLTLAHILGGLPLLATAILAVLWQIFFIGRSAEWVEIHPRRACLLLALEPTLFFAGGAFTWLGTQWTFATVLAFVPVVYFLSLAHTAGQLQKRFSAPAAADDPLHTLFSHTRLEGWQAVGYAAAGFASLLGLVFLILAENCRFYNSIISPNFARCIPTGGARMVYFELGPLNGALFAFDLVVLCLLIGLGLSRLLRPLGGLVNRLPQGVRRWAGWGLVGAALVLLGVGLLAERSSWLGGAALVWSVAAALRTRSV